MKASFALRSGASRGQLRVLIGMLLVLLIALVAFMVVALTDSHHSGGPTLGSPTLSVGAKAPIFDAKGVNGHGAVTSASLLGTTTVLNFFASWCVPCKEETPLLGRTAATDPKGVKFAGIDVNDTDRIAALKFLAKAGVTYAVGADLHDAITQHYGVESLPTTFLIGPNGRVEAEQDGAMTSKLLAEWISMAQRN